MRKKLALYLMVSVLGITMCSCGKSTDKNKTTEKATTQQIEETTEDEEVSTPISDEMETYEQLFDINNQISVQINISDEELQKMQADYDKYDAMNSKSPIYRKADSVTITVGDEVYEIEEVGIRIKGNTSRDPIYDEATGNLNLEHYRLSFDETFDDPDYYGEDVKVWENDEEREERKDRTFATLSGLEVKWNTTYDNTYIREYYANSMFRDNGILVQQLNLCNISMNGENCGIYRIYEPIDKKFIEKNLPEEDWGGDLYKCGWTNAPANYTKSCTYGIKDEDACKFFNFDLKTNKSDSKNEKLINLLDVVNNADLTKENLEKVVDTDYFVKFMAVSYFVGSPDDIRNNYNNHYLYFLKSSGKAIFIPYDNDRCFGLTQSWNPDRTGMTAVSPFSEKAEGLKGNETNPIIKKTILSNGFYVNEYKEQLAKVAEESWLTTENFNEIYETVKTNYQDSVQPTYGFMNIYKEKFFFSLDGTYTEDKDSNMSFEEYITRKLETYNKAIS